MIYSFDLFLTGVSLTGRYLTDEISNGNVAMQIVSSGPDEVEDQVKEGYLKIINSARNYLYIQSPYLVPDQSILEALKLAVRSGVNRITHSYTGLQHPMQESSLEKAQRYTFMKMDFFMQRPL